MLSKFFPVSDISPPDSCIRSGGLCQDLMPRLQAIFSQAELFSLSFSDKKEAFQERSSSQGEGKELEMKKRNGKSWARGTVFAWLLFIILLEITIGTADIRREQALDAQEAEVLVETKYIEPIIPLENEETESKTSVTLTNEDFVDGVATVSFGITLTTND